MNIFVLENKPKQAAEMACDKHVVKMALETAQMLCTVAHQHGHEHDILYLPVHAKHPCTIWAGECWGNWRWLCVHGIALCNEYTYRYEKTHKCEEVIRTIFREDLGPPKKWFGDVRRTDFAQAMPVQYKHPNAVTAYRQYYLGEKKRFAKWTKRKPPVWWSNS